MRQKLAVTENRPLVHFLEEHMADKREGDMIVNLQKIPAFQEIPGIKIKQVHPCDMEAVVAFIREQFSEGWVGEARYAMMQDPVKCFIAVEDKRVVGFACYDSSTKDFFGPIGVHPDMRGRGVGNALMLRTLHAMKEYGYGYAVIGWVGPAEFYAKTVGARFIEGGTPDNSVYQRLISM